MTADNMRECPFCAQSIKVYAKICPFCQKKVPPLPSANFYKERPKPQADPKAFLIGLGALFVLMGGIVWWGASIPSTPYKPDYRYVVGDTDGNRFVVVQLSDGRKGDWTPKAGTKVLLKDGEHGGADIVDGRGAGKGVKAYFRMDQLSSSQPATNTPTEEDEQKDKVINLYPAASGLVINLDQ